MLVSRFAETRPALWLAAGAGISTIAAFALLAASPAMLSLIAAVSRCAVGQMLVGPLVPTAVNALAPSARRASYMAASSVAVDLKDSLGPSIGTALCAGAAPALDRRRSAGGHRLSGSRRRDRASSKSFKPD